MSIEIRLLKKGEEEMVNEVYNNTHDTPRPIENFYWEFINAPAGSSIYVVAMDHSKQGNPIIGTQCAIPIYWTDSNGGIVLTGKSEDTFVDPSYRGQKLFDRMYDVLFEECRKAGIKIIWGFTYARKPFLKVGFDIPADTIQGLLVNDIGKASAYLAGLNKENKAKQKIQIAGLCTVSKAKQLQTSLSSAVLPEGFTLQTELLADKSHFVSSAISLNGKLSYDLFQSAAYSDWRLKKNPFRNNYSEMNYFKDGRLKASVLANFRPEGFAYLEQMYFDAGLPAEHKAIIVRNAIAKILEQDPFLIRFWGFEQNAVNAMEMDLLKKAGFLFLKKGTGIVWKNLQPAGETPIEFSQVHLSRVYTQGNI